jgi:hypothetical protein
MREIARLHGVPHEIVLERDPRFTSNFWKRFFKVFWINLNFMTPYHPYLDFHTKRINHIIEYMLIMYLMDKPSIWEDYIHLVEFVYNNGYQESLNMSPLNNHMEENVRC